MKVLKKFPSFLLAMIMCISMFSMTAWAASASQDGLEITLTTDKEDYTKEEQIMATLTVKNTNDFAVTNVSLEQLVPDGYKLPDGSSATKHAESLGAGETIILNVTYTSATASTGGNNEGDNSSANDDGETGGNTTNNDDATNNGTESNGSTNNSNELDNAPKTGDENKIVVPLVLFILSIASIVFIVWKTKKGKQLLSLFLCFVLFGTLIFPNIAQAASEQYKTCNTETVVKVKGVDVKISAKVTYGIADSDEQNNVTVTFYLNYEDAGVYETITILLGERISQPENPIRDGYSFDGWYMDATTTTAYSFDNAVTGNLSLYAKWNSSTPVGDNYTVTFESNGGTAVAPISVAGGTTISAPTTPTKEDYIFMGWYTTDGFDEMFLFDDDVITKDTILYADWLYNDQDAIITAYAASQITIGYQSGDNSSHVTQNVSLPTTVEGTDGVSISWNSNLPETISSVGIVNRPADSDQSVTLTVTVSKGSASETRDFIFNVVHTNDRDSSTVPNNSVIDLQNMNQENEDFDISYNNDKTQVTSIEGLYSEIIVENADDALDAIQSVHTILGIDDPYAELEFANMTFDEYGTEYAFKQYYGDYEVHGRTITVSVDENGITDSLGSGVCASQKLHSMNTSPAITSAEAESIVLSQYGTLCSISADTRLMVYSFNEYENTPVLVYEVNIVGTDKSGEHVNLGVFVNTMNGEVVTYYSNILNSSEKTGSGKTESGDKVSFPVAFTWTDWYFYYMQDLNRNIQMYSENWLMTSRIGSEFNHWGDKTAVSAYTNMIKVYDWYKNVLKRNSVDNNGMKINVTVHDSTYSDNAYWDGSAMFFCDNSSGSGNTTASGLDVAGHEFTHGVVQYVAGDMHYSHNYLGSINEGYADIFGCLIEGKNWTIGEDWKTIRDAANPESYNAPSVLNGRFYLDPQDTSLNVSTIAHRDSSLVYHAAYLMSEAGMSSDMLAKLWYKSLSMHYDATSDFHTVRQNVLKAAKKIHLSDSEIAIIKKAFDDEHIYGDSGTLAGVVSDSDGNWVTNASVTVSKNGTTVGTYSVDSLGGFTFALEEGSYSVQIDAEGFISMTASVIITENEMTPLNVMLVRAGNGIITGTVVSATTALPLDGVSISVRNGFNTLSGDVIATASTDANGRYSIELPAGYYTFELAFANYTPGQINVTVEGSLSKVVNGSLSPIIMSDTYRIVLTWGNTPKDLDSHLTGTASDGKRFHIYYRSGSRIAQKYDGTEIGNLDVDDTDGEGPETITFKAETEGTYMYYVYRYSDYGSMPASGANVKVYNGDNLIGNYDIDSTASSDYRYWTIFKIENGIFHTVNSVESGTVSYSDMSIFKLDTPEPAKVEETVISSPNDETVTDETGTKDEDSTTLALATNSENLDGDSDSSVADDDILSVESNSLNTTDADQKPDDDTGNDSSDVSN